MKCIDFMILVELITDSNAGKNRKASTVVYPFKFDSPFPLRSIAHTFANKVNKMNPGADNPVYSSLRSLYEHRQGKSPNKVHGSKCESGGGCHSFFYNDRMKSEASVDSSDEYYAKFAEEVALYLRLDIGEERDYVIVKPSSDKNFIFCKFRPGMTIEGAKYCKAFTKRIEDVDPDDIKTETDTSQSMDTSETEHGPEDIITSTDATNEVKTKLQDLINDRIKPHIAEMKKGIEAIKNPKEYSYKAVETKKELSQYVLDQLTAVRSRCSFKDSCSTTSMEKITAAVVEIEKNWSKGLEQIDAIKEDAEKKWENTMPEQLVTEKQNIDLKIKDLEDILSRNGK